VQSCFGINAIRLIWIVAGVARTMIEKRIKTVIVNGRRRSTERMTRTQMRGDSENGTEIPRLENLTGKIDTEAMMMAKAARRANVMGMENIAISGIRTAQK